MLNIFSRSIRFLRFRSLFLKLFFENFLIIVFAVFLICILLFVNMQNKTYSDVGKASTEMLQVLKGSVDEYIVNHTISLVIELKYNPALYKSVFINNPRDDMYTTANNINMLNVRKELSGYIDSVYMYNSKYGVIVSTDGCTRVAESQLPENYITPCYDIYWLKWYRDNRPISGGVWIGSHFSNKFQPTNKKTDTYKVITYIENIVRDSKNIESIIAVNIKEKKLFDLIKDFTRRDQNEIAILDKNNRVITIRDFGFYKDLIKNNNSIIKNSDNGYFSLTTHNNSYFITITKSDITGWKYISIKPYNKAFSSIGYFKKSLVTYGGLSIVLGIFVIIIISLKQYSPIKSVINLITGMKKSGNMLQMEFNQNDKEIYNEYEIIENTISSICQKMNRLEDNIRKNESVEINNLLLTLILESTNNTFDIHERLVEYGINLNEGKNRLVLVHNCCNSEESHKKCLARFPDCCIVPCIVDSQSIVYFVNTEIQISDEDMTALVIILSDNKYISGVSSAKSGVLNISTLFKEAREASKQSFINPNEKAFFFDELNNNSIYALQKERHFETIFLKSLNSRNIIQCKATMDEAFKIISSQKMSYSLSMQIIASFITTLKNFLDVKSIHIQILNEKCGNISELYRSFKSIYHFREWILSIISISIEDYKKEKASNRNEIVEKAKRIILSGVYEDISGDIIAERLFISSSYLRRIFFVSENMNLSDYIYTVKMKTAAELLLTTGEKVEGIAAKLKYNTSKYFIKRFKEYYGMTPREYRYSKST